MLVVIRHVNERTYPLCLKLVKSQTDKIRIVNESPFIKALYRMYKLGEESQEDLLLAIDADVLLSHNALEEIEKRWKKHKDSCPNIYRLDFLVQDKFRGRNYAGCHLYNNIFSKRFAEYFKDREHDPEESRPESTNVMKLLKSLGMVSRIEKKLIVGKHDFEQYYHHVYSKYYNRAMRDYKSYEKIYNMIREKQKAMPRDKDFTIALKGMEKAKEDITGDGRSMRTDSKQYFDIGKLLLELGVIEKSPLL